MCQVSANGSVIPSRWFVPGQVGWNLFPRILSSLVSLKRNVCSETITVAVRKDRCRDASRFQFIPVLSSVLLLWTAGPPGSQRPGPSSRCLAMTSQSGGCEDTSNNVYTGSGLLLQHPDPLGFQIFLQAPPAPLPKEGWLVTVPGPHLAPYFGLSFQDPPQGCGG